MRKIQLSIPEPCHEQWDNMTPTQQGRYCNACAKEVIDFSNMSDSEVLGYFIKNNKEDNVCGRAYPDQLDRDIAALPQKKKHWRWYYVLSAFLFMMKPAKTKAQGAIVKLTDSSTTVCKTPVKGDVKQCTNQIIKAQVKDEEGDPVAFASILIAGTVHGTRADADGRFNLAKEGEDMKLVISGLGYETKEITMTGSSFPEIVLKRQSTMMKEVVMRPYLTGRVGGMRVERYSYKKIVADTIKSLLPQLKPGIKIYPNPVAQGSSFTIHLKLKQTGNCTIQVVDAAGRLMCELKVNAAAKNWKQPVNTNDNWSSGMYYVKVLDDKGMLIQSGSLAVQ
jgi:CarboxypepD_reg-like domain/Secretion system C-terminal sorting domain